MSNKKNVVSVDRNVMFPIKSTCKADAPGTRDCPTCGARAGYYCVEYNSLNARPHKTSPCEARRTSP